MTKHFFPLLLNLLSLSSITISHSPLKYCKPVPGDSNWPTPSAWANLNSSVSGRLLAPPPPGAVCHPTQPTFNAATCPLVQLGWGTTAFHADNPISTDQNNWNNDSCLPILGVKCSGEGYPIYVIDAHQVKDVQMGVQFAKQWGVRLIVKGTGHDYLGRSVAANALSIWTHHLTNVTIHASSFTPQGCPSAINSPALTALAGEKFGNINVQAASHNLTVLSGGAETVGVGGYLTGGGHAAYSNSYGLAADNVLEMEVVTASGEALTINECQHQDLFWAMRGGGGSTYAILTSVTMKAFPSTPFASLNFYFATPSIYADAFWDSMAYILSELPALAAEGIVAYTNLVPNLDLSALLANLSSESNSASSTSTSASSIISSLSLPANFSLSDLFGNSTNSTQKIPLLATFSGALVLPLLTSPQNHTSATILSTALTALFTQIQTLHPTVPFLTSTPLIPTTSPDFQSWYATANGPLTAGSDMLITSRLLPPSVLAYSNATQKAALISGLKSAIPPGTNQGGIQMNLVSGPQVWNPPNLNLFPQKGGKWQGNAVNPAWRKASIHAIVGVTWPPGDVNTKRRQISKLRGVYAPALKKLAPGVDGGGVDVVGGGTYVNEADPGMEDWERAFWGDGYERLRGVKRRWDGEEVLVCRGCVGWERGWEEVDAGEGRGVRLCRV